MAERRFELALQWLEENPDVPERVLERLQRLYEGFARASTSLNRLGFTGKQNDIVFKGLQEQYRANYVETVKGDIGFRLLSDALDAQEEQAEAARKRLETFGRSLRNTGVRLGWLGYRMTIIGRMMLRWMMGPINTIIRTMKNWERTIGDVALTLGLLQATGMGSAESLSSLRDILERLPEVALRFDAVLGALQAIWARIAVDVGPVLTDILIELADAFYEVWNAVAPSLIPVLETLKDTVLEPLLDLIREVGPAILINLVQGALTTIGALVGLLNALRPILPSLAWLLGALLPLAPVFIAIGTAAYILSPILMTLGSAIMFLAHTALVPLIPILAGAAAAVSTAIAVFNWLKGIIGPIPAMIAAIVAGFAVGMGVFYAVSAAITAIGAAGVAASPGIVSLGGAVGAAGAAAAPAIPLILSLGAAIAMAGAGFLMAGAGVMLAVDSILKLAGSLNTLIPLVPVLAGVAVGMLGVAAAGIAMLPAASGVFAMAGAMTALSISLLALTSALWALIAALKAYKEVADVAKSLTDSFTGVIKGLGDALSRLCFRHAIPMAEAFNETIVESTRQTRTLQEDVEALGSSLRGLRPGAVGVAARGVTAEQYVTVYPTINIGSISSTLDLATVTDAVNRGIAEALRRRG